MWQRFTERARASIIQSQTEAISCHHDYVGTEHILLALMRDESGVAAQIVVQLGHSPAAIRRAMEAKIEPGPEDANPQPQLTAQAKRLLELSADEARRLRHGDINTGHMLLALLRLSGDGKSQFRKAPETHIPALQVLEEFGVILTRAREKIDDFPTAEPSFQLDPEEEAPSGPWQRFTERARLSILSAQEEAEKVGNLVTPEYILLGILRDRESIGAQVLEQVGVHLSKLRAQLPPASAGGAEPKLSPEGKQVLEKAADEARQLGHKYIGTEHLLLALRHDAAVAEMFRKLGVDSEELVARVQGFLEGEHPEP